MRFSYLLPLLVHGQKNAKRVKSHRWISEPNSIRPQRVDFYATARLSKRVWFSDGYGSDIDTLFIRMLQKIILSEHDYG